MLKHFSFLLSIIVLFLSLSYLVSAWTEPSSAPPLGNVSSPLNIGSTGQSKSGGLSLNTGGAPNGLIVELGNVGIGTTSPGAKLEVAGQVKITGGSPGTGKVLTSDASGLASWQTVGGGFTDFTMVSSAEAVGDSGCSATVSCPPALPYLVACLRETCGSGGGSNCGLPDVGLQNADWDATSCTASLGETGTCCAEKCRARALCGAK